MLHQLINDYEVAGKDWSLFRSLRRVRWLNGYLKNPLPDNALLRIAKIDCFIRKNPALLALDYDQTLCLLHTEGWANMVGQEVSQDDMDKWVLNRVLLLLYLCLCDAPQPYAIICTFQKEENDDDHICGRSLVLAGMQQNLTVPITDLIAEKNIVIITQHPDDFDMNMVSINGSSTFEPIKPSAKRGVEVPIASQMPLQTCGWLLTMWYLFMMTLYRMTGYLRRMMRRKMSILSLVELAGRLQPKIVKLLFLNWPRGFKPRAIAHYASQGFGHPEWVGFYSALIENGRVLLIDDKGEVTMGNVIRFGPAMTVPKLHQNSHKDENFDEDATRMERTIWKMLDQIPGLLSGCVQTKLYTASYEDATKQEIACFVESGTLTVTKTYVLYDAVPPKESHPLDEHPIVQEKLDRDRFRELLDRYRHTKHCALRLPGYSKYRITWAKGVPRDELKKRL